MENIYKSASKIVFILMAISVVTLTFMKIVEAKDFITLATMAFTFYFANKGNSDNDYLGK